MLRNLQRRRFASCVFSEVTSAPSSLLTGLISYCKMDEYSDSSTNVLRIDSSGRGNDLTDDYKAPSVVGKISNAVWCNSSTPLSRVSNLDLQVGDIDAEWVSWINLKNLNSALLWAKSSGQYTDFEYGLSVYLQTFEFYVRKTDNSGGGFVYSPAVAIDTWYMVDMFHDSANNKLGISINNSEPTTIDYSGGVRNALNNLNFGNGSSSSSFYIDEVGFWKRVLTPEERTLLYNGGAGLSYPFGGATPPDDPTYGYAVTDTTKQVVFVGDSLTYGLYCSEREKYVRQTMDALSFHCPFVNRGVSQRTIADVIADAANVDALYNPVLVKNYLVVDIGINDMRVGTNTPSDAHTSLANYCAARQAAGWTVIVNNITPASDIYMTPAQAAAFEGRRAEFNAYIAANHDSYSDAFADVAGNSTIGDSGDEENKIYFFDRLHWTPSAATIVAGIVKTAIESS